MMFHGAVERFDRRRISGWARVDGMAEPAALRFELLLRGHPALAPAATPSRGEGMGFVFDLPAACAAKPWAEFVAAYDAVVVEVQDGASTRRWRPQMYKNVLLGGDVAPAAATNRTTLAVPHLRAYALEPTATTQETPQGGLAVFTLAQGDPVMARLWGQHYAAVAGAAHLFVLDDGTTPGLAAALPPGTNILALPTAPNDPWQAARLAATFQRFLLESYDSVLFAEPDALLCADPTLAEGRPLHQVLLALQDPIAQVTAFRLWHDIEDEPTYNPSRPVLAQRRILVRDTALDRPLLARVPLSWTPGLGRATEGGTTVPGLYMLHLRSFDLDHSLVEAPRASRGTVNAAQVAGWFRVETRAFREATIMRFDPDAARTKAADWMQAAIAV